MSLCKYILMTMKSYVSMHYDSMVNKFKIIIKTTICIIIHTIYYTQIYLNSKTINTKNLFKWIEI